MINARPEMPEAPLSLSRKLLRLALVLVLVAAFGTVAWWIKKSGLLAEALLWIKNLGVWAPVVFIALYVATVIICLPAAILTAGGGFIFGMTGGSIYVLIAAHIAANVTFLLGRYLARDWVARRLEGNARFRALDAATARDGWKIVALVRLAPVFPFSITSYGFGLTRVPLWEYALANFAMIPGTLMYVYFGSIARDLTEKVATPPWMKWTAGALTVIVVIYITRFAKRALNQRLS
jgi:uncharacterized membrane protein YdjX (TVP38/TMEM64 family)